MAIRALRELICSHRPDDVLLSETNISDVGKIDHLCSLLGCVYSSYVPSTGSAGDLLLL